MTKTTDQTYLKNEQYQNSTNLDARVQLHARFSTNKYGWQRWVFDQLELPPRAKLLELGCGPAYLWQENANRIPSGWDITLTDFSPGMVAAAKENLKSQARSFAFKTMDAQSIPYDDHYFDAVMANHMLYHVPDKAKALAEIRRVLKPGGQFYATTIGESHLRELDELIYRFEPAAPSIFDNQRTYSFTLENGQEQLAQWFSPVTCRHYEDALVITEAAPLLAYAQSMVTLGDVLQGDKQAAFSQFVEQELAREGSSIYITKSSGLFIAGQPEA